MIGKLLSTHGVVKKLIGKDMTLKIIKYVNSSIRKFAANWHKLQFEHEWMSGGNPMWFDHFIDVYRWSDAPSPSWVERGCYSLLVVQPGARILDLCCGDGFYAKHFYAPKASSVVAADFDPIALAHAMKYNSSPKVEYIQNDIRQSIPKGEFDNIIWDASIQLFTEVEQANIIKELQKHLSEHGILSGYTVAKQAHVKSIKQTEHEFLSGDDLEKFLSSFFESVFVFETVYPERTNIYFFATDGSLPFEKKRNAQSK